MTTLHLQSRSSFLTVQLHVLTATVSLMRASSEPDDPRRADLETLQSTTEQLHRLVNDYLDLSALRQGKLKITASPTDMRMLVRRVAAAHRSLATVPIYWRVHSSLPHDVSYQHKATLGRNDVTLRKPAAVLITVTVPRLWQ